MLPHTLQVPARLGFGYLSLDVPPTPLEIRPGYRYLNEDSNIRVLRIQFSV